MALLKRYYEILELKYGASPEEVKKAYRNLAKIWHPDRFINEPEKLKQAEAKFREIVEAYECLANYESGRSISTASTGISIKRSDPEIFYQQGVEWAEQKKYQEAIEEFSKAIRLNPEFIEAYQYRAHILSDLGYENRAEADFKKIRELKLKQKVSSPSSSPKAPDSVAEHSPPFSEENFNNWKCTRTLIGHSRRVNSISISKNGDIFASGSDDGSIKIWQLSTEQVIETLRINSAKVNCVVLSDNGKILVSGSADNTVQAWDLASKKSRTLGGLFAKHSDQVLAVALSPDSQIIISGSADKTIKIWQTQTGKELYTAPVSSAQILSVAISYDSKLFVSGGLEQNLRIRDLQTRKIIRSIKTNSGILSVAFSPHGKLLAGGGFDRAIKIWDINNGQELWTLMGHNDRVSSVTFSPDNQLLISGSWDRTIKLWSLENGQEIETMKGHLKAVSSVAMSPDGKKIISGSHDRTIKIWQTKI